MKRDYTYIVVGLGGIGSAAAYWLARRAGDAVLGLEQFEIGHGRGASQDHSRIIRRSYHSVPYVALTGAAYDAWDALEDDCGEQLIVTTGGLDLWPAGATGARADYTSSMRACAVAFEELDAADVMRRWPAFRLDDGTTAVYQADAGIAAAARCNAAHVRMARRHGATLLERSRVDAIRPVDGEFEVAVETRRFRCREVIVCADAWTNELLSSFGVKLPVTVTQEQATYWATARPDEFAVDRFPVWIWMGEPSFYGFPVFGEAAVKAGQDVGGAEVTARTRDFATDERALQRVETWLEHHLPDALGPILYTKTCLYTMPPDRDFVIDRIPEHEHAWIALGAAHGFKFASWFGRTLADLATTGATEHDISCFRIDRPALEPAPSGRRAPL